MFSETTIGNQSNIAPIIVSGEPFIENGSGKHVPHYQVEVDIDEMTWGDSMVHVRFQLLLELVDDVGGEDPSLKIKDTDEPDVVERKTKALRVKRAERIQALRDLTGGFDELTAFLNRIAIVRKDGVICQTIKDIPLSFVHEIMEAIAKAKNNQGNSKN